MPYIPDEKKVSKSPIYSKTLSGNRNILDKAINKLAADIGRIHKAYGYDGAFLGLVHYSVTRLVTKIILDNFDKPRYWHSAAIKGVLQDIGDELYRRVFVPYEELQTQKNGDISEYQELIKRIK